MTFGVGRSLILALVALTAAACQSSDTTPQPAFASSYDQIQTSGMPATAVAPTQNSRYFIEFRSRYALTYGHTYAVFGQLNQAGQMVKPEVAGLAPKSDDPNVYVLGHVLAVPASTGWTDGDLEEEYRSASWRVMLTEAEYRDVVENIRKLQARSKFWHASLYNCNAFVADIARSMGYKTPGIWLRPQQFITTLREMNQGKKVSSKSSSNR
ncbi:MAG TPA: hypothetical protein VIU14_13150 [Mesorhizobium sp.]|jgi:hypothetical protein